jgi:hypothetical protein
VLLFFVPTFVVVAEFPEGSRIEAGSRYRIDRVDPDSGSPVTWTIVDGRLVAAGNVLVDGRMYDVEFVEGRCPEIFDGCDDPLEDFAFHDGESAKRAAQALLDQVLLDDVVDKGVIYNFDSLPTQMYGCSHTNICDTVIPYDLVSSDPPLLISSVYNASPGTPDSVGLGVSYEMNADSSQRYLWNYAKFTLSQ